jgi:hypothetical protein
VSVRLERTKIGGRQTPQDDAAARARKRIVERKASVALDFRIARHL